MKFRNVASKFLSKVSGKKVTAVAAVGGASLMAAVPTFAATTSEDIDMSGVTLPFTVGGMLNNSVNFLSLYGQWIALALGVLFAPVLYGLAMKLVNAVRAKTAKN